MKKLLIATAVALSFAASAADVSVSGVRDFNGADTHGLRVGIAAAGLNFSVTQIEDKYNRYAVGKDFELATVGPVKFSAGAAGVFQDTRGANDSGYGLTAGVKTTVNLAKSVDFVVGAERFIGQDRVKAYNGNVVTAGLAVKF